MDDSFGSESNLDSFYLSMLDNIISAVAEHGVAVVSVNGKPVGLFKNRPNETGDKDEGKEAEIIQFPYPDSDTEH